MGLDTTRTEADAVAQIARQIVPPIEIIKGDLAVPVLVHESNKVRPLESLERFLPAPLRKRAVIIVRDLASFIAYVNAHKETGSLILAQLSETGGLFDAIIDYHNPASTRSEQSAALGQLSSYGAPKFGEHICRYECEHSPEWKRWMELSAKPMGQADMALFIEDNMFDIVEPESARMLEMVKTLEATQGVEFRSAVRLDNGDRQFLYAQRTGARAGEKGEIEIPQKFKLAFPVFVNGKPYDIDCRFRYSIRDGALSMAFEIERPHKIVDAALSEIRLEATRQLSLPVLLGSGRVTKV